MVVVAGVFVVAVVTVAISCSSRIAVVVQYAAELPRFAGAVVVLAPVERAAVGQWLSQQA